METGWISLHRKVFKSAVWLNDRLWRVWCCCLLLANHEKCWIPVEGQIEPVLVQPGQFITGRFAFHKAMYPRKKKSAISPSTSWRYLKKLEKSGNLNIKTNNRYSLITIVNWDRYQYRKSKIEQPNEQQLHNSCTTVEQQLHTNNNDNNVNNGGKDQQPRKVLKPDFKNKDLGVTWFEDYG